MAARPRQPLGLWRRLAAAGTLECLPRHPHSMNERPAATAIRLADYAPPAWRVETVTLRFELGFESTTVHARLALRRDPRAAAAPLELQGEGLELVALALDGQPLERARYNLDARHLVIALDAPCAVLESTVRIR